MVDRVIPRGLATALSILLSILLIAGLFTWIGFSVAGQWGKLGEQFSSGITTILDFLESSPLHLTITNEDVQGWLEQGQEWLVDNSSQIASQALSGAGSVAIVFGTLALAIFCTVFFLTSGKQMWHWFLNQLPARFRSTWLDGGDAAWFTFSGYTRGTVIVAAADGVRIVHHEDESSSWTMARGRAHPALAGVVDGPYCGYVERTEGTFRRREVASGGAAVGEDEVPPPLKGVAAPTQPGGAPLPGWE